jgi:hypothetical protein
MPAGYQELFLEQGSNFSTSITLDQADGSPFTLTGSQVKAAMKKSYYSSSTTANFVITVNDPTEGIIILSLPYANTANISAGRYVYDVIIKDSSNTVIRVLEGVVNVLPQVTVF